MATKQKQDNNTDDNATQHKEVVKQEAAKVVPQTQTQPQKQETVRTQMIRIFIGAVLSILFMTSVAYLVFEDKYRVNITGKINGSQLLTYWHKLEFVICYQIIGVTWLLFCINNVMMKRVSTHALNPLSGCEDLTLQSKNILSNSIEQFLISFFAQIISISFLDASILIKIIPLINLYFLIGRITFWFGYPKYRTFGFLCAYIPSTLLIAFNLYKFVQNLFF